MTLTQRSSKNRILRTLFRHHLPDLAVDREFARDNQLPLLESRAARLNTPNRSLALQGTSMPMSPSVLARFLSLNHNLRRHRRPLPARATQPSHPSTTITLIPPVSSTFQRIPTWPPARTECRTRYFRRLSRICLTRSAAHQLQTRIPELIKVSQVVQLGIETVNFQIVGALERPPLSAIQNRVTFRIDAVDPT